MKKIFLNLVLITIVCAIFLLILAPATYATKLNAPGILEGQSGESGIAMIIGRFIKAALAVVGAVTLIMFIYGGYTWLTAAGIADKITKGKGILVWAIIGLTIVLLSYTLVDFVIYALVGSSTPVNPDPPPTVSPVPPTGGSKDCVDGSTPDSNGCCGNYGKYSDGSTSCVEGKVGGLYRCCDCGNTNDSQGFECKKGDKNVLANTNTVIEGHCGKANWWCSISK